MIALYRSRPRSSRASTPRSYDKSSERSVASLTISSDAPWRPGVDRRACPGHDAENSVRRLAGLLAALFLSLSLLFPLAAFAVEPSEMLADPKLEARARTIASELRCLVCQNQSIDDSDAPLAKDLRLIVREKLKEGASDAEVREFVVARYGDFVLLRPPFKIETLALWGAPFIALLGGGYAIYAAFRRSRRRATDAPASLTDAERAQLRALGATIGDPQSCREMRSGGAHGSEEGRS
jgi:cytochrome c-type biogenesis protein CcmH